MPRSHLVTHRRTTRSRCITSKHHLCSTSPQCMPNYNNYLFDDKLDEDKKKKLMVLFVCVLYFACTHNNFSLLYFEMMVEKVCTTTEFFKYIFIFVYFKVFVFGCSMNLILLLGDDHDDTITIYINISTVRRVHTVNALNNIKQWAHSAYTPYGQPFYNMQMQNRNTVRPPKSQRHSVR